MLHKNRVCHSKRNIKAIQLSFYANNFSFSCSHLVFMLIIFHLHVPHLKNIISREKKEE